MRCSPLKSPFAIVAVLCAAVCGCAATTTVTITPPDQPPICQPQQDLKAAVLWRSDWRPDQKDVSDREAAAAQGITRFFADGDCFRSAVVARTESKGAEFAVPSGSDLLLVLTVRELGPIVKLLSSAALVEGGTEVVLDVVMYLPGKGEASRKFSIRWQNGGPGVVKGVQTLSADIAAALQAGLRQAAPP
jgi:hypothetical protein